MSSSPSRVSQKQLCNIDMLISQGKSSEAETEARQLVKRYPKNGEALGILGLALVAGRQYEEALPMLQQAYKLLPEKAAIMATLGTCLMVKGRPKEALPLLKKALVKQPDRLSARTNLGDVYIALGNVAKGRECFIENLRRDPSNIGSHYSLSNFITYQSGDQIFEKLPPLLKCDGITLKNRATVAFTLGKAYWDIGDNEQAFAYYHEGNSLKKAATGDGDLHEVTGVNNIQPNFDWSLFLSLQAGGLPEVPQLIVAGMSRSGKSLVESLVGSAAGIRKGGESHQLRQYVEQILKPHQGDLSRYLSALTPEKCRADAQGYLDYIGYDGNLVITTRPADIWAFGLFGLWFPKALLVFCQRDIFDLGITAYFNHYTEGNDHTNDLYTLGEHIAYYEQAMQHWAKVLPNPIYWVNYEELTRDPQAVSDRLLKGLGKKNATSYEAESRNYAEFSKHLSPVRSLDVPMPIRQDFNGIAKPFMQHLGPLRDGYQAAMQAYGLPCEPIEHFDWQLKGRLVVVDNAARLPREDNFRELMATNAFGVVAFDPASRVAAEDVSDIEEFQHVPHAFLGDGQPATLYATLDANFSAPLEPLPPEHLPENIRSGATVLTRVPINTLRLDDIEGLKSLDWLILDELSDAMGVLENGKKALVDTLLLQVGVAFSQTHKRQPNLAEVSHWASRHGFAFYRLNDPRHRSLLPEREDVTCQQATQLASADALFIPAPERMSVLNQSQRQRLAFILDTVFGIHDLSYQLLAEDDPESAERYLKVRGYKGMKLKGNIANTPSFIALRKPKRVAERGLATALANHNIHRTVGLAQQLLKEVPDDPEGRYYLGQALSHLGQHEQALAKLTELCESEMELRYWLALGFAQCRAGQAKAAKRTHEQLAERFSDHLAVARFALELTKGSHKRREQEKALVQCKALLEHKDSALVAAGLGDALSARADLLGLKALFQQQLANQNNELQVALQTYREALKTLGERRGPLRARLLMGITNVQLKQNQHKEAVESLWKACNTYPYSLETVTAYTQLRKALAESKDQEHQKLTALHGKVQEIWRSYKGEQLQYSFGDFGLPYQGFEPLMLPGTRSANARLAEYQLEKWLPDNATALDIGCNHGFLLVGLADKLQSGEGFDISKACVDVGNEVAKHLGYSHIKLHHKAFDDFAGKKQYDLVIACAVHQWIGKPLENFGDALLGLCKPGGIVLLESQGARDRFKTEPGFEDNAAAIASAGFNVLDKGSICDDSLNYREFWVFKRSESEVEVNTGKSVVTKARRSKEAAELPVMEGSSEVITPMRHIYRLLVKNGAWFNPDLRVKADNGNLSLHGTRGSQRASYVRVPVALMPLLNDFDITLNSDKLIVNPNGTSLLPHHHEIIEAMVEIYNVTDKIKHWRESFPFLAWKDKGLLKYLLESRPENKRLHRYVEFSNEENKEIIVDSFLGSRKFGVNSQYLKAIGGKSGTDGKFALLPLVDCLNHHLSAEGFNTPMVGKQPAMRTYHTPDSETGELFVRYNLYDAVDTTLIYGFIDEASHWLGSVPTTLNVCGRSIIIKSMNTLHQGVLPTEYDDIRSYMPGLQRDSERDASVTKLMFCIHNPQSLRRVLRYLVYTLGIAYTELVARQQVAELEKQLIEKNLQWWHEFARLTDALPNEHPAKQLCEHSLSIIRKYQEAVA